MTNLENAMAGEIPNLDAQMSPQDMRVMRDEFRAKASVLRHLASYCEAKENAMWSRLQGKMEMAKRFEDACDAVYKQLPGWARW